jgi:hypothetical protein
MRRNLEVASWPWRTDDRSVAVEFLTDEQAAAFGQFEGQFPLARVVAVLSSVPDRSSPLADLQEDGLMTGTDRSGNPRGNQ